MYKLSTNFRTLLFGASALSSAFLFTSCGDDDEKDAVTPEVDFPTEFSPESVEQNKAKLEQNGIDLVNNLTEFKNSPGIKTAISFSYFLSEASLPEGGRLSSSSQVVKLMQLVGRYGEGKASISDVVKGARAKEDDEQTPQEIFNENKGTYTYSKATNQWTFEGGGDRVIFKFPSVKTSATNDAEFAIYGFQSTQVTNEYAEYTGDLPTALKADLTVGGAKQIEYNFSGSYKSNGDPTAVSTSLTIGKFKLSFDAKNQTSEVSVNYGLTKDNNNLISFGAGAKGNFSSDNIGDDTNAGDIITESAAYFQLLNIRIAGEISVKSLQQALDVATTIDQEATAWNNNSTLVVFYADSKKKIADTEFYGSTTTEEYSYCYDDNGDGIEDGCETEIHTDDIIEIRLVFVDGSKSDLATYTEVGFEDVEDKIEEFIDALEADLD